MFVWVSVAVTVTPGTAAPCVSTTLPSRRAADRLGEARAREPEHDRRAQPAAEQDGPQARKRG